MKSFLTDSALTNIVNSGAFGKGCYFVSFERDLNNEGEDQFQSIIVYGSIKVSDGRYYQVIIKINEGTLENMNIDVQFHNEIQMYKKIIPFLMSFNHHSTKHYTQLFPKFYSAIECDRDNLEKTMIVLENMHPQGYRLSENRLFLDFDHLASCLRAIAKFHALSYTAKNRNMNTFKRSIEGISSTAWDSNGQWVYPEKSLTIIGKRGLNRLLERDPAKYRNHKNVKKLIYLLDNGYNSLRQTLLSREPLAVLCHGDFCRNNVMFRYDHTGRPLNAILYDFSSPKYGSPALDLSFIMYMNMNKKTRETRWNELLDIYHSCLLESVPNNVRIPSRSELDSEMASCIFYGFIHIAFFLPFMVEKNPMDMKDYDKLSSEEKLNVTMRNGSDEGTDMVADIVQHIIDMEYL